jgi:hypothetical protein
MAAPQAVPRARENLKAALDRWEGFFERSQAP